MNCNAANQISILDYMKFLGFQKVLSKKHEHKFYSPIHNENTPSFFVNESNNTWYDFGLGKGGSLIDLIVQRNNFSIQDALAVAVNIPTNKSFFLDSKRQEASKPKDPAINIQNIQQLQTSALVQYVESRGVSRETATGYLKEVYYKNTDGKKYFALCFANDKNGFELRNKYFKGCTSPKTITTIKGKRTDVLTMFEGFFDFLSALQHYMLKTPNNTTVVLNSLSHLDKFSPELSQYKKVHLFLDNDKAGIEAAQKIAENHKSVVNQSQKLYPEYKDFNEFLNSKK